MLILQASVHQHVTLHDESIAPCPTKGFPFNIERARGRPRILNVDFARDRRIAFHAPSRHERAAPQAALMRTWVKKCLVGVGSCSSVRAAKASTLRLQFAVTSKVGPRLSTLSRLNIEPPSVHPPLFPTGLLFRPRTRKPRDAPPFFHGFLLAVLVFLLVACCRICLLLFAGCPGRNPKNVPELIPSTVK